MQQICGLSGSEADNIRRAIGRKQKDRLDKAMPSILEGYCSKSSKSRAEAESEAKEFLQVIEDSASYQFGYNHSVAYCLLGYLCAYYRYYYPIEFITAFLNNAANEDDIKNGTAYANKIGVKVTMPKWGVSKSVYSYDLDQRMIAKGLSSVKYMNNDVAEILYDIAHGNRTLDYFVDALHEISKTKIDSRQLEILTKIDFFSHFGNQRELMRIQDLFDQFKKGEAKKIKRKSVFGPLQEIIMRHSTWHNKKGAELENYTLVDTMQILREAERHVLSLHMDDIDTRVKIENFKDAMGYYGYSTGKEEDRQKLYVLKIYPLYRKKDNKQFGYSVVTKSVGSGKEARFTVFNDVFDQEPLKEGDIIFCKKYTRNGIYFTLNSYYIEI